MINAGTYLRLLLRRRKMTQMQLVRKMKAMGFTGVEKTHVGNFINNTDKEVRYTLIRKIEIALDLPEFSLIKMAGNPTEAQLKKLKKIKPEKRSNVKGKTTKR